MEKLKVMGVCAGNGVCLYPFKNPKLFEIVGNWEPRSVFYDPNKSQWEANFPDVEQSRELIKHKSRVDVIIGHPDCGDNSILRLSRAKEKGNANENVSLGVFAKALDYYKPKFFMMENLPGLLKSYENPPMLKMFPDYHIITHVSSVANYGNSQMSRVRLVIIGISRKLEERNLKYFKLPELTLHNLQFSQEFELGDKENPSICHVREPEDKTTNLYYKGERKITYSKARAVWNMELRGKARWYVGGKMKNQPGVTRNLPDTFPLTVRKQNRQFTTDGRVLSPREMANIQGVPKAFKLIYRASSPIYWINKARLTVTKTMPYELADWFMYKLAKLCNNTKLGTFKTNKSLWH